MKNAEGQVWGREQSFPVLSEPTLGPASSRPTTRSSLTTPLLFCFFVFFGGFITWAPLVISPAIVEPVQPQLLSAPWGSGDWGGSPGNPLPPLGAVPKSPHLQTKDTFSKSFRGSMPEMGTRPNTVRISYCKSQNHSHRNMFIFSSLCSSQNQPFLQETLAPSGVDLGPGCAFCY